MEMLSTTIIFRFFSICQILRIFKSLERIKDSSNVKNMEYYKFGKRCFLSIVNQIIHTKTIQPVTVRIHHAPFIMAAPVNAYYAVC